MILAGEFLEVNLGATLAISTMAAAAIGNLISDVVGLGAGGVIESGAARYGVQVPATLTAAQLTGRSAANTRHAANVIGITVGCILGMFPLLFYDEEEARLLKVFRRYDVNHDGELDKVELRSAFADAKAMLSEADLEHLFTKYATVSTLHVAHSLCAVVRACSRCSYSLHTNSNTCHLVRRAVLAITVLT